jgi:hypothetical protein
MDPTDKPWGDEFNLKRHATIYSWHPLTGLSTGMNLQIRDEMRSDPPKDMTERIALTATR